MKTINQEDFTTALSILLRETFEGMPTKEEQIFLAHNTGIFATLADLSAEQASTEINGSTIAAHSEHARFYMELLDNYINRDRRVIDFKQSWQVSTVSADEWDELREKFAKLYGKTAETLKTNDVWGLDTVTVVMGIIAHTAYHLGAIRQMTKNL